MSTDPHALSLIVRGIHVAAMAIMVGGAALVLVVLMRPAPGADGADENHVWHLTATYEALFWLALGLLVMTGIGNLAAFGPSVLPSASPWGQKLFAKLIMVGLLMLASVPRTMLVAMLPRNESALAAQGHAILRVAYGMTLGLGLAVLALAMALARG